MGNCLLTKLKGSVNNDNLPKLNTLVFSIKSIADTPIMEQVRLGLNCNNAITVKVIGNGWIVTDYNDYADVSKHVGDGESVTLEPLSNPTDTNVRYIYVSNSDFKLEVSSKYEINDIVINTGYSNKYHLVQVPDFSELTYCPLQVLSIPFNMSAKGNIGELPMDVLKSFACTNETGVTGNISDLKSTALKKMSITQSGITGSIEDFVSAQYDAGRTSVEAGKPVQVNGILGYYSLGGSTKSSLANVQGMYWNGKNKIAVYVGGSWVTSGGVGNSSNCTTVYVKGFVVSDTEVVAWKAAGKTVIDAATNTEL